jgi:type IV secretion system protein VirD4
MRAAKVAFALVVLAVASLACAYLAGAFFVLSSKRNPAKANLTLTSYLEYRAAYGDDPAYQKRLKGSALAAFLVAFGVPGVLAIAAARKPRPLHGAARFASRSEIRASGLMGEKGIVVGKYEDKYLVLEGEQFAIVAAPTRGGKGVGIVIPNLLTFQDSLVVLDPKLENYEITSGFRAQYQEVFLFNPFAEDLKTSRYNPLGYVRDGDFRVGDLTAVAEVFYPTTSGADKDAFFNDQARALFVALGLYLCETPGLPRTIGELLRQSSGKGKPIRDYFKDLIAARASSDRPLSMECVDSLNRVINTADNTLSSIVASFNAPLGIWLNPIVDAATSANDFDLRDIRRKRMTIYAAVTPDHLAEASRLLNLFFSQLINLNTKTLPQKDPSLKYQCLLLLDEFAAIGRVGILTKAVAYMAGYNLRLLPIFQSVSQLADVYGESFARTFITNHALQILFAPREQKDANELSEMLGYDTVQSKSVSRQVGLGKGTGGRNESESEQRRALLLPQELKEIGKWKEIVIFENTKPILCEKIRYYDDPTFKARLLKAPPIPVLDLDTHRAKVQGRVREMAAADVEQRADLSKVAVEFAGVGTLTASSAPAEVEQFVDSFFAALDQSASASEGSPRCP